MAQNWSLFEGAKAILANDEAAIAELGKRFPLTTVAIASMGNNAEALKIFEALPINVTMRKVEANLKGGVETEEAEDVDSDVETTDEEAETPKKAKKAKKATSDEDKKAAAAERRKARRAARKAEKEVEPDEDENEDEEETTDEETTDYSSMNAIELFKLCKSRGIKAAPKKKAAEYIKLLEAADAEATTAEEDSDDGWGDDEEEEAPAPKKSKKESKKAAEEDDDDWDI